MKNKLPQDKDLLGVIDALDHPLGINAEGKQVVRRALVELLERRKVEENNKPVVWPNGCDKTVPAALRYLAENERPFGGESRFNTAHLYQLAREVELMAGKALYGVPPTSDINKKDAETAVKSIEIESTDLSFIEVPLDDMKLKQEKDRQIRELVMFTKMLAFSLRKSKPDSKLPGRVAAYLSSKRLTKIEDILR